MVYLNKIYKNIHSQIMIKLCSKVSFCQLFYAKTLNTFGSKRFKDLQNAVVDLIHMEKTLGPLLIFQMIINVVKKPKNGNH